MTTVTMDRAVVEQVLSTLEGWDNHGKWVWPESALQQAKRNTTEALTSFKEALAQPPLPVQDGREKIKVINGVIHTLEWTPQVMRPAQLSKAKLLTDQQLRDMCVKYGWDDSYQSIKAYRTVEAMSLELNQLEK